jgi:hypothetical protein
MQFTRRHPSCRLKQHRRFGCAGAVVQAAGRDGARLEREDPAGRRDAKKVAADFEVKGLLK